MKRLAHIIVSTGWIAACASPQDGAPSGGVFFVMLGISAAMFVAAELLRPRTALETMYLDAPIVNGLATPVYPKPCDYCGRPHIVEVRCEGCGAPLREIGYATRSQ